MRRSRRHVRLRLRLRLRFRLRFRLRLRLRFRRQLRFRYNRLDMLCHAPLKERDALLKRPKPLPRLIKQSEMLLKLMQLKPRIDEVCGLAHAYAPGT
jgi:hypothetical protein